MKSQLSSKWLLNGAGITSQPTVLLAFLRCRANQLGNKRHDSVSLFPEVFTIRRGGRRGDHEAKFRCKQRELASVPPAPDDLPAAHRSRKPKIPIAQVCDRGQLPVHWAVGLGALGLRLPRHNLLASPNTAVGHCPGDLRQVSRS